MKTEQTRRVTGDWQRITEALCHICQMRPRSSTTNHEAPSPDHASPLTDPASALPGAQAPSPTPQPLSVPPAPGGAGSFFVLGPSSVSPRGFTLVEMLVVIGIILILAAMVFPITGAVKRTQIRTRARGELLEIETAIEAYKAKLGYYPPDSAPNYLVNQLYYELLGTTNIGGSYQTLDGSAQIAKLTLPNVFGPNVSGFMNCTQGGGSDEGPTAVSFLKGLKPGQILSLSNGVSPSPVCTVLGASLDGPQLLQSGGTPQSAINPWRYNSSNPRYNTKSFDLWIDVTIGGKTNRICNWDDQPLVVSTPYL